MELKEMITRRRSVRHYRAEAVDEKTMAGIRAVMAGLEPLVSGAGVEARMIRSEQASFLQKWRNPHFLAIFAQETDDALMNVGFMYQQLDLYLQSLGLGTCWVGLGWLNDGEAAPEGMKLAVMMAFGYPDGVTERADGAEFNRKAMAEITDQADDRLEVVRLAPSATNSQPWYFTHDGEVLHAYRESLGRIKRRTHGRLNAIDMGIALAHLRVSYPETFRFWKEAAPRIVDGYDYVGSVQL
ncbi:MAG: nitroreductase [Clostridia bacterium]|nr:nitroreductase [Clostridia bacterium]